MFLPRAPKCLAALLFIIIRIITYQSFPKINLILGINIIFTTYDSVKKFSRLQLDVSMSPDIQRKLGFSGRLYFGNN